MVDRQLVLATMYLCMLHFLVCVLVSCNFPLPLFQVGYISEYPHTGQQVSAAEGGLPMDKLFWGGKVMELDNGKKVFGQVWPKVRQAWLLRTRGTH